MLCQQRQRLFSVPLSLQDRATQDLHDRILRSVARQLLRRLFRGGRLADGVLRQCAHSSRSFAVQIALVEISKHLLCLAQSYARAQLQDPRGDSILG